MKRSLMALALLTSCSLLSSCGEPERIAVAIPIPPERMDCAKLSKRPSLPAEQVIDYAPAEKALNVKDAVTLLKVEIARFVASVRTREGRVAGYILAVEGDLFACSNDAEWLRDYSKAIK